jgi:hypothetical protein
MQHAIREHGGGVGASMGEWAAHTFCVLWCRVWFLFGLQIPWHNVFVTVLQIHFVWAGAAVVVFSSLSAALMAKLARKIQSKAETGKSDMELKVHDQKMRVLRIAVMMSVCLLVNTVVTIWTSVTLEGWSKASDLDLQCSLFETWDTRDILSYGIEAGDKVCTFEDTTGLAAGDCGREEFDYGCPEVPGNRDCYYRPQYDSGRLKCYGLNHEGGDGGKGGEDIGCDW